LEEREFFSVLRGIEIDIILLTEATKYHVSFLNMQLFVKTHVIERIKSKLEILLKFGRKI